MIRKRWIRLTIGTILGGFAGLSLTATILPTILATFGMGESFFNRFALSDYAAHSVLVWAMGGWAVARVGFPLAGAIILGVVGLVSGVGLGVLSFGTETTVLLATGIGGALYGAIGGLILGQVLQPPPPEG